MGNCCVELPEPSNRFQENSNSSANRVMKNRRYATKQQQKFWNDDDVRYRQQQQQQSTGISGSGSSAASSFFLSPTIRRSVFQLSEEEQIQICKRIGMIAQLPVGYYYEGCTKNRECVICMVEYDLNDQIRSLPCMHIYHSKCIDDWLMRSFTCPSCLEPVDVALNAIDHHH